MQSLPLEAKVRMTEARIKAWHEHWGGDVYISFSGGKDSTVLKHIADSLYPSIPSVFVNTGLEYPEVRSFALRQKNVIRLDPAMRFYDVIETDTQSFLRSKASSYTRLAPQSRRSY